MDLHNGLDIEVYDLRPTNLHYYYYYYYYFKILSAACNMLRENISTDKGPLQSVDMFRTLI